MRCIQMVFAILSCNFYAWPDGGPSGLKYVHAAFCYIMNIGYVGGDSLIHSVFINYGLHSRRLWLGPCDENVHSNRRVNF
jgi:hypothetical protein